MFEKGKIIFHHNFFSQEQLAKIIKVGNSEDLGLADNPNLHHIKLRRIYSDETSKWAFDKFKSFIEAFWQPFQYTFYEPGDWMSWHVDSIGVPNCLASFDLMLTDPNNYEGGIFQIKDDSGKIVYSEKTPQGTLIIMAPEVEHQVTKVTSGSRRTLLNWALSEKLFYGDHQTV